MDIFVTVALIVSGAVLGIAGNWFIRPHWLKNSALVTCVLLVVSGLVYFTAVTNDEPNESPTPKIILEMPTAAPPAPSVSAPPSAKFDNTGGWGPERPTFTDQSPATYAVFNSITNSAVHGDERSFIQCRDDAKPDHWSVDLVAIDQHWYTCVANFNNDIAANLDNGNPAAVLHDARIAVNLPSKPLHNAGVSAFLSASNAQEVWATCNFFAAKKMAFAYKEGSAVMFTNGTPKEGLKLAEKWENGAMVEGLLVKSGSLLGFSEQDGEVRHSYQHSGYVNFKFQVYLYPEQ